MSAIRIQQQKVVVPGEPPRSWDLDLDAMASCARWSRRDPDLLAEEMRQIAAGFPTFVAALGLHIGKDRCWVEAAEPLLCSRCSELVVFDRGTRCALCGEEARVPEDAMIGAAGRIPALISGRPFGRALGRRLSGHRRQGDGARAAAIEGSVLEIGGRLYLAPRFWIWFSRSWPHADPPVMVGPEYFPVLDIPPDHVYTAAPFYRLCLFASWREQPARAVLQNRVAPRLLIDLMVADLRALGRLDEALERLRTSLYALYNVVGRPGEAEPFRQVYEELVRR